MIDGILHPSNKLGSHINGLCGHNNMLEDHMEAIITCWKAISSSENG